MVIYSMRRQVIMDKQHVRDGNLKVTKGTVLLSHNRGKENVKKSS